jgi:alpha-D-ribose 1-methylphosphonate 5-triphosphate synthase subunit PhnH
MTANLTPGFASAADAQKSFRAILNALSRPGRIVFLPPFNQPPPPLSAAAAAILLTLTDPGVSVSLPDHPGLRDWLAFHTGARLAPATTADFVVALDCPSLPAMQTGTDDEPESGATLILETPRLESGPTCRLTGPGIQDEISVQLPLSEAALAQRRALHKLNPRGIDILFCAGNRLLGLPRSTEIEEI